MTAPSPTPAFIALGGNLGDVRRAFAHALHTLDRTPGLTVRRASGLYRTRPISPIPQPDFLNAAAELSTTLPPQDLLQALHDAERAAGRDRAREQRWGPRTLDLDLLVFGPLTLAIPGLTLPHPRLHERRFVLSPLAEIAPGLAIPGQGATATDLLRRLPDDAVVLDTPAEVWFRPARPNA